MFVLVFFSLISNAIASLGNERAVLCAFRAFVCFARVCLCLFHLQLGVRNWLRLVIVALPGLFFLLLFKKFNYCIVQAICSGISLFAVAGSKKKLVVYRHKCRHSRLSSRMILIGISCFNNYLLLYSNIVMSIDNDNTGYTSMIPTYINHNSERQFYIVVSNQQDPEKC